EQTLKRPTNYVWLPNGIDTDLVGEYVHDEIDATPSGKVKVTYAGSFGPSNSVSTLLDAIKIIKTKGFEENFEFTFIGDGSEKEQLKLCSRNYNLTNVT